MKYLLATTLLIFSMAISAGEFSKIDLTVRETLEAHYADFAIDIFEDISELKIGAKREGCLVVVSAEVSFSQETVKEFLCVNKQGTDYTATVIEME